METIANCNPHSSRFSLNKLYVSTFKTSVHFFIVLTVLETLPTRGKKVEFLKEIETSLENHNEFSLKNDLRYEIHFKTNGKSITNIFMLLRYFKEAK